MTLAATPRDILARSRTIAVVGASRDPGKPGHGIPAELRRYGFRIIPVNPYAGGEVLFGEPVRGSLLEVDEPVDIVDVFRPAADAPEIARQAVAIGAGALWLQSDIVSPEARGIAEAAGMDYVEDRCTGVERALGRITAARSA
ncbi:MAG TPA: CoA-binding protein [Candidatus Dormibacteraeota bacterium]|jgi:predicted CoA-binding protein|nr:CoA-binding protein [Candidatus Dormibacteraeota bacterium]